jgi:hypothetical protein
MPDRIKRAKPRKKNYRIYRPPPKGKCLICNYKHGSSDPHAIDSALYEAFFINLHRRKPTWADALAHCLPHVRRRWERHLRELGKWSEPRRGGPHIIQPEYRSESDGRTKDYKSAAGR